jgi:hypothetical protein
MKSERKSVIRTAFKVPKHFKILPINKVKNVLSISTGTKYLMHGLKYQNAFCSNVVTVASINVERLVNNGSTSYLNLHYGYLHRQPSIIWVHITGDG